MKKYLNLQENYNQFDFTISLLEKSYELQDEIIQYVAEETGDEWTVEDIKTKFMEVLDWAKENKDKYKLDFIPQSNIQQVVRQKFPQNIIYFITQFINWLINLVKGSISGTTNALRRIAGLDDGKKFNMELITKPNLFKKIKTLKPESITVGADDKFTIITLDDQVSITESTDEEPGNDDPKKKKTKTIAVINIDKDIRDLREMTLHFIRLFENSFGSNGERLFATDDLDLVLRLIKDTLKMVKSGSMVTYSTGVGTVDADMDLTNIKSTLVLTHKNVEALRVAYQNTQDKIKDIAMVLTHKQLYASTQLGQLMRYFSNETYNEIIEIQKFLKPYKRKLVRLERDMQKMGRKYEKVANEIVKLRAPMTAIGKTAMQSVRSKRINDLFDAARHMNQIVTLRLSAISMYTNSLEEIYYLIDQANSINRASARKNMSDKFRLGNTY